MLKITPLLFILTAIFAAAETHLLKVMSFNIRYGAANDGSNSWPNRKDLVLETIKASDPDLLGLQEVLGFQADFLKENLPGYAFHGVGREDGKEKGEYVPLMYKTSRFALERSGHFWFSETPDVAGSKSWDSSLPRMLSWVALRDLKNDEVFIFANAHFDHRGKVARLESAKLMRQRWESIEEDIPLIITGDFNTTEDGAPYAALTKGSTPESAQLIDTYRVIHPDRQPDESSFGGWKGVRKGTRIDWILHSDNFSTRNSWINYMQDKGRFPSDHYPVGAVLSYK
ncbi:endonuclease/exonuclease/phosphatase family protein [Akkermansiaceae bacterium]|nr:endonuclease/exonuclease/phosphatase family protein [Akkermansiaceae bacterium]